MSDPQGNWTQNAKYVLDQLNTNKQEHSEFGDQLRKTNQRITMVLVKVAAVAATIGTLTGGAFLLIWKALSQ